MTRRRIAAAVVGMPLAFVAVVAVEAVIAAGGEYLPDDPGYLVEGTATPAGGAGAAAPVRMVMLGDSTVAGLGAPTVTESLALQTAQRVADRLQRPVMVTGLGVSGARTSDIADQLRGLADPVDVVVIVVGSNDVTHVTPPWRMDDHTRQMLLTAREEGGQTPVVLGGIPLFGGADALAQPLRWVVDSYARPLRRIQRDVAAGVDGVTFVNIAVEASPRFRGVPEAMSADGFHPAPTGYGFWADALTAGIVTALGDA